MRKKGRTKAELLEILASIEWVMPISNSSGSCPYCGHMRHWGHANECDLADAIKSREA